MGESTLGRGRREQAPRCHVCRAHTTPQRRTHTHTLIFSAHTPSTGELIPPPCSGGREVSVEVPQHALATVKTLQTSTAAVAVVGPALSDAAINESLSGLVC